MMFNNNKKKKKKKKKHPQTPAQKQLFIKERIG